ncbi:MAG: branched-chain amino acid ABC transporter permease [Burkholderiaceae bacterium]|jgi:branched-chain amino acid transport system permease protein
MTPEVFLHQLFAGLTAGAIYASLAVALVMVWRSTHHLNFAQGEMAMFSTYVALALIEAGLGYWTAFAATLVVSFIASAAIERLIVAPVARSQPLATVIVFVALLAIFHSLASWLFTPVLREFPSPFPAGTLPGFPYLSGHAAGVVALALIELAAVWLFFRFTRLGLAMRAVAQNPVSSRLVGISAGRMLALGWGLAGVLGACAGMMIAPIVYLDPNMMAGVLLYGFAATLLGGIDNPWGAAAGGLIVGLLDALVGAWLIGPELKLSFALALIVAVLLVRPAGLFARTQVSRV